MSGRGRSDVLTGRGSPALSWLLAGCLAFCTALFLWASPRGYDVTDEAYYLISIADPYQYQYAISKFGYLFHPLYLLVGGDVAWLRVLSFALLCGSGGLFGWVVSQLISRSTQAPASNLILPAVTIGIFWQYDQGMRTPNYNLLNLCALLWFFTALIHITPPFRPADARKFRNVIAPAMLAGIALATTTLCKPTATLLAAALGFAWVALLRPPFLWLTMAVTAATAAIAFAIASFAIVGSPMALIDHWVAALAFLQAHGAGRDAHSFQASIAGPFVEGRRWKILPALGLSLLLFAIFTLALELNRSRQSAGARAKLGFAFLLLAAGFLTGWWRTVPPIYPDNSPAYGAWYFAVPLVLAAAAFCVARRGITLKSACARTLAIASALLALVPFAYSFGTDNAIIRHMAGAAVFWMPSALLLVSLTEPALRSRLTMACCLLLTCVSTGMFAGALTAPGALAKPIWQQTQSISIGMDGAHVLVDPGTASYIGELQQAATALQMRHGTRIIDLSRLGPGVVFAIAGISTGTPWMYFGGPDPAAYVRATLGTVPRPDLECAWVLTGSPAHMQQNQKILVSLGLPFPAGYRKIADAEYRERSWAHTLWMPRSSQSSCR